MNICHGSPGNCQCSLSNETEQTCQFALLDNKSEARPTKLFGTYSSLTKRRRRTSGPKSGQGRPFLQLKPIASLLRPDLLSSAGVKNQTTVANDCCLSTNLSQAALSQNSFVPFDLNREVLNCSFDLSCVELEMADKDKDSSKKSKPAEATPSIHDLPTVKADDLAAAVAEKKKPSKGKMGKTDKTGKKSKAPSKDDSDKSTTSEEGMKTRSGLTAALKRKKPPTYATPSPRKKPAKPADPFLAAFDDYEKTRKEQKAAYQARKAASGASRYPDPDDNDDDVRDPSYKPREAEDETSSDDGREEDEEDEEGEKEEDPKEQDPRGTPAKITDPGSQTRSESDESQSQKKSKRREFSEHTKIRSKHSPIWDFFEEVEGSNGKYVRCIAIDETTGRVCHARIKRADHSTSGMNKHLTTHPKAMIKLTQTRAHQVVETAYDTRDLTDAQKKLLEATDESRDILGKAPLTRKMPVTRTLHHYFEKQSNLEKYPGTSERQKRIDLEIMTYLARSTLPLSHVDRPCFKE